MAALQATDADVRELFALDPSRTHLSPGAYGAVPWPVLSAQRCWRQRAEADPHRFHRYVLPAAVTAGREAAAEWLGVSHDSLALLTNVTEAASTLLASLELRPGDEIVLSNHGYGAVRLAVDVWCERAGAVLREAVVPLDAENDAVVDAFTSQLTERTRLVVVDLITSPTARILPVSAVAAGIRASPQSRPDAMVLVDSAHSPGHLPVDIAALGVDAWMGNLHKWAFGARGTAVLWLAPQWRESVRPLVLGWQATDGFPHCFDARGTADLSAWMVIPDALALWHGLGGWTMAAHNAELAAWGQRHVADEIGVSLEGLPATPAPAMRLIPLPPGIADTDDSAERLYGQLSTDAVEVGVIAWGGRGWLRPGSQVFTTEADHERLADVLVSRLG